MNHPPRRLSLPLSLAILSLTAHADTRPPVEIAALRAAQELDAAIVAIDGQIGRGEWEAARAAAAEVLERSRSTFHGPLQIALVRLALLEAKLGRDEEALGHWQALAALGGAELGAPLFARFGAAAEKLRSWPVRAPGEIPTGVEGSGTRAGLTPARRIAGEIPQGDAGCTAARGPLWARFEAVINAEGKLQQPTITGPSVCFSYEVLRAARHWTFEPARREGVAVASLYVEEINPSSRRPLRDLTAGAGVEPKILALLEAGELAAAEKRLAKQWDSTLEDGASSRRLAVTLMALRALALAGHDEPEIQRTAICLWQASQAEEPAFDHLDLAPFGAAGQRLATHRYGELRSLPVAEARPGERREAPRVLRETWQRPRERFAARAYSANRLYIEAMIDETGAVREPFLFERLPGFKGFDLEALDHFCAARFQPATIAGRPVAVLYVLSLTIPSTR